MFTNGIASSLTKKLGDSVGAVGVIGSLVLLFLGIGLTLAFLLVDAWVVQWAYNYVAPLFTEKLPHLDTYQVFAVLLCVSAVGSRFGKSSS